MQFVLSGFSMRLLCFVQAKYMWVWLYIFLGCTRACDGDVICVIHDYTVALGGGKTTV